MQPRHQLGALIQAVEDANGWSDPDVAERARHRGHTISKSNISRLRLEPVRSIKGDAVKALAAGLGISPLDVADAALASMGIHRATASDVDVEAAIRRDPVLAESQRRMLLALLREMRDTDDENQGTQDPPSNPPPDGAAGISRAPMSEPAVSWPATGVDVDDPTGVVRRLPPSEPLPDHGEPRLSMPYVSAARDLPGISEGERRRLQGRDAGEENQDPGDDWEGA